MTGGAVRYLNRERQQRFWSRGLATEAGCLEWQGARLASGYGVMSIGRNQISAHRLAVQLMGFDVRDKHVCHRCDNPPCYSPAHLFVGSHLDNMRDLNAKGMGNQGERNPMAKLTDDAVRFIRASARSNADLAEMFSVGLGALKRARRGEAWRHVA